MLMPSTVALVPVSQWRVRVQLDCGRSVKDPQQQSANHIG
jgi:hypothetical protein